MRKSIALRGGARQHQASSNDTREPGGVVVIPLRNEPTRYSQVRCYFKLDFICRENCFLAVGVRKRKADF